ncbi:MAG: hypothetical protein JNK78_07035 [Planctomycetes bacterium]|nr:hypothetical protein [Planctomycetota bacterium]
MTPSTIPFAQQRLVCVMLLVGIVLYSIGAAVALQVNDGKGFSPDLPAEIGLVCWALGGGLLVAAFVVRAALLRAVENAPPAERAARRFPALLAPIAILEGGALFGITIWMLLGDPVPGLVVACVLFAAAVFLIPLSDPDA